MRHPLLLALTCSFALGACGGSEVASLDAGFKAMQAGDYAKAVSTLDEVLGSLDKADPDYKSASMIRLQSMAHVDADQAKTEFLAMTKDGDVTARQFSDLVTELYSASKLTTAIEVLDAGIKALPGDPTIQGLLEKAKADALKNPDGEGAKALEGLGYLGGE